MKVHEMNNRPAENRGFTLIELIVVVAIIVLLISVLIPAVSAARASARRTATLSQMEGIKQACENYYEIFPVRIRAPSPNAITSIPLPFNQGGQGFSAPRKASSSASRVRFTRSPTLLRLLFRQAQCLPTLLPILMQPSR